MAPNKLTDDEIRRLLQQIGCESDCDIDNDFFKKFDKDSDESETHTQMEMETVTHMNHFYFLRKKVVKEKLQKKNLKYLYPTEEEKLIL